jgi:hypothetical protein
VAGVPAVRAALKDATDGVGEDSEELVLAPTGDATKRGVVQIQLVLRPPRGEPSSHPVDRARLDIRDAVVADFLTALFPNR